MKFPGDNKLTFTNDAIQALLKAHASAIFGDRDARITKIKVISYPEGLEVAFTTDPDPSIPVPESDHFPEALRLPGHRPDRESPRPVPANIADDDHPF